MLLCKIKKVICYNFHIIVQCSYKFRIRNQIIKLYKTFSLIYIHAVDENKIELRHRFHRIYIQYVNKRKR